VIAGACTALALAGALAAKAVTPSPKLAPSIVRVPTTVNTHLRISTAYCLSANKGGLLTILAAVSVVVNGRSYANVWVSTPQGIDGIPSNSRAPEPQRRSTTWTHVVNSLGRAGRSSASTP
jgi:hypothetical protein